MIKPLSEELQIKGTLFFLYLGQLIDLGLLEGGDDSKLTVKGYDLAMDSYEEGHRLTDADIIALLEQTPGVEGDMVDNLFELINHLQEVGYDEMKQQVSRVVEHRKDDGKEKTGSI